MRDRPVFDSEHPDEAALTTHELAAVDAARQRRRALQAAEDEIPETNECR